MVPCLSNARNTRRLALLAIGVLFIATLAVRLAGAWWCSTSKNPDYGVVVLMARHMAEGRHWPVFFYGQPYMGSLEPSVSGALALVFGPSPFVVCLGTALVGMLVWIAVYRWARDLGGVWAGLFAAAAAGIGPTGYFQYMASPRGGYALGLLLTVLLLREGACMAWQARSTQTLETGRVLRLGFLVGLGFWNFWLTLPAAAAAGVTLWAGLRWRLPRIRIWLAGLSGFLAGSLPFWIWNAAQGWLSFGSQQIIGGPRQFLANIALLFADRLPLLLDLDGAGRAKVLAVLVAHGVLLVCAWTAFRPRRGVPWSLRTWSLAAIGMYTGLFILAYGMSSFSMARTPRYLLPFVPLFAVTAGTALALSLARARAAGRARRTGWQHRTVPRAFAGLATASLAWILALHLASLPDLRAPTAAWVSGANEIADTLARRGIDAAMADFVLYGFNWATDERLCCSSPMLERYPPFAQLLEQSEHPAVLENFRGFDHFLAATQASANFERIGGYRVHSHAQPPARATVPVPRKRLATITDQRGTACTEALTDLFLSTTATVFSGPDDQSFLEVVFTEPTSVCGIRAWVCGQDGFADWSVEGRRTSGSAFEALSEPHVLTGYFWSGPRFYHGGTDWREEKRFEPTRMEALRIRFHQRGGRSFHRISELQILQDGGPSVLPDIQAIATAAKTLNVTRIYADRWLANRLHPALAGTVWTSREPSVFGPENGGERVLAAPGTALAVEPDVAESVRLSLQRIGVTADEQSIGNVTLFALRPEDDAAAAYRGLRFRGKLLAHAHQRALAEHLWAKTEPLAPAERVTTIRSALDTDPGRDEILLEIAELLSREGHRNDADALRRNLHPPPYIPLEATFFRGFLSLLRLSAWPSSCHPGDSFAFESEWHIDDGFRIPDNIGLFVHFLHKDRIVFQMDTPLVFKLAAFDPEHDIETSLHHVVSVPETVEPGLITPVVGLYHHGVLGWREAVNTPLPTQRRRVVVPGIFEVLP